MNYEFDGFMEMFAEANGAPIVYNGKKLIMSDSISIASIFRVSIELLSCNSEWRQGIVVSVNGSMDVDVGRGEVGSEYVFWEEIWTDLKRDEIYIWGNTKDGTITIYNVWDDGSGRIDSFYNGSAMIKEVINNKEFIYYCNDGHFDDDFNDIIFKVKIL